MATLEVPPEPASDEAGFFPLPAGFSVEPKPFSDAQIAELSALFRSAPATPPGRAESGQDSGSRTQAA